MLIKPVDDKQDLFSVSNALPKQLLEELNKIPLDAAPFTKMEWQEDMPRRRLVQMPESVFEKIHNYINEQKQQLGMVLGKDVSHIDTAFWYDLEGFTFPSHVDNAGVKDVLQIYLTDCADAGTVFYEGEQQRIKFDCITNTGYLMINNENQKHGVPHVLGKNDTRLSLYCWIK
jgi:hypothetical protein